MALRSDSHQQNILKKFNQLRKQEQLCDITLIVEDVHFKAHRALLAASSDYFALMFTAEDQVSQAGLQLAGTAAPVFAKVMDFIYSAQVSVDRSAMPQLLAAARLMEVSDLVRLLSDLPREAEEVSEGVTVALKQTRRKRGRPKKAVSLPAAEALIKNEPSERAERKQTDALTEDDNNDDVETLSNDNENYYLNVKRPNKRKIRPPQKYSIFKVGSETAEGKEMAKRGRKRKYHNTETRCDTCGKEFKNHFFLKIHQRTHTGSLQCFIIIIFIVFYIYIFILFFKCCVVICCFRLAKTYLDVVDLLFSPPGEKPFSCQVCSKSFTQKHTLVAHQRIHTGEKPFVCSICSRSLSSKHTLQEHMNLHESRHPARSRHFGFPMPARLASVSPLHLHSQKRSHSLVKNVGRPSLRSGS